MPRFLLNHIIFDHGLVDGLGPDQPRLQGNLLCKKDWIQLREIARSEWEILPVQEVAAYTWCTMCEHLRSGTCPKARRAKWAHVGLSPWYRCASKVGGPGCLDSFSDSEREHWEWDLGKSRRLLPKCARTSAFATTHRAVPARAPFPRAPVSATAGLPEMSPRRMRFFIRAFISLHAAWNLCSPAAFWLRDQHQRSSSVVGSQAVGSRRSGTEPLCEEIAYAGRPRSTQQGRMEYYP